MPKQRVNGKNGGRSLICLGIYGRFVAADARLEPFCVLCFNFFLAVEQRLYRALALFRLVRIERMIDSAQGDMQRHAALFPAFDQRPVNGAEQQMLAAASNEGVFDFGEVRKIIQTKKPQTRLATGVARVQYYAGLRSVGAQYL